jgi:nitrogen fixation NifU-like protein
VYSSQVLDHFEHPRGPGVVESPDAVVQLENPACGDVLKLSARMDDGRIAEIRFLARGCVPSIACGSALTELAKGKTLQEMSAIRVENIVQALGSLPEASTHASHLAFDALAALLRELKAR